MRHLKQTRFKFVVLLLCLGFLSSCSKHASPASPAAKRYPFTGRIVSVDKASQSAMIDGDTIQGFMEAMTMSYKVKSAAELNQLSPGDSVSAEIVVVETNDKDASPDYWLENVKVTGHAKPAEGKPSAQIHIPAAGEEVPDFKFTNQNERRISLGQYRGKVVFLTFIYTRCPFPDYCPRVG